MTAWISKPLGDLCQLINGRAFKPSDWSSSGLPIVRIQNLNDPTKPMNYFDGAVKDQHRIDSGDLLLAWSGTPGTSFGCFIWSRGPAVLNQHIFKVLVDQEALYSEFFMFAVNSKLDEMIALAHGGVGLRHITKEKLEAIELPLPPLGEQRRIVARIKACMERIDEIELLRQETTRISTALLPAQLNDISLAAWPEASLAEVLEDTRNGRSIRADGEPGNGAVLTLSAVRSVMLDQSAFKAVTIDDDTVRRFQVREMDVFISRANTYELVGLSGYVDAAPNARTIFPDLLIRLTPKADKLDGKYLAYALRFPKVRKQIQERASGSSQSMVKISGERLREVRIPVPSLSVQKQVAAELDVVRGAFADIGENLVQPEVAHLRSAVLRKAFAGEL